MLTVNCENSTDLSCGVFLELPDESGPQEIPRLPNGPYADDGQTAGDSQQFIRHGVQHGHQVRGQLPAGVLDDELAERVSGLPGHIADALAEAGEERLVPAGVQVRQQPEAILDIKVVQDAALQTVYAVRRTHLPVLMWKKWRGCSAAIIESARNASDPSLPCRRTRS